MGPGGLTTPGGLPQAFRWPPTRDSGDPAPRQPRDCPGRPCPASGAYAQAARKAEEEALPYAAPELAGVGRGSCDPSPARQQLRLPRPLFLLQQRRLVKGKDVRGGGSGGREVSRDLGGTLAQPGTLAPPTNPDAGGERSWGRSTRARLREEGEEEGGLTRGQT